MPIGRLTPLEKLHTLGTYNQPNGGEFGKIAVAMLQSRLKNDREAAKMFVGADCGLCQDPQWHVSKEGDQLTAMNYSCIWKVLGAWRGIRRPIAA